MYILWLILNDRVFHVLFSPSYMSSAYRLKFLRGHLFAGLGGGFSWRPRLLGPRQYCYLLLSNVGMSNAVCELTMGGGGYEGNSSYQVLSIFVSEK